MMSGMNYKICWRLAEQTHRYLSLSLTELTKGFIVPAELSCWYHDISTIIVPNMLGNRSLHLKWNFRGVDATTGSDTLAGMAGMAKAVNRYNLPHSTFHLLPHAFAILALKGGNARHREGSTKWVI